MLLLAASLLLVGAPNALANGGEQSDRSDQVTTRGQVATSSAATTPAAQQRTAAPLGRSAPRTSPGVLRVVSGFFLAAKGAERTLGPRFAPGKWLPHFGKHAGEFGYKNSVEYLKGARDLVGREGVETFTRANGDRLFYDAARNEFAAMRPDGVLRTYFRPKDGADYRRTQIGG